jgi:hypothetical protein
MNAIPKLMPIRRVAVRPAYRGWVHVQRNEPEQWIAANLDLIRTWWRIGHERDSRVEYDENDFQPFCRVQFDIERMRFEEYRDDAKGDDINRYLGDE